TPHPWLAASLSSTRRHLVLAPSSPRTLPHPTSPTPLKSTLSISPFSTDVELFLVRSQRGRRDGVLFFLGRTTAQPRGRLWHCSVGVEDGSAPYNPSKSTLPRLSSLRLLLL